MASKKKTLIIVNPSESKVRREAAVEILESMGYSPIGGGTKASITLDDSHIEIHTESKMYKAVTPGKQETDYTLPDDMYNFIESIKVKRVKTPSIESERTRRQKDGYTPGTIEGKKPSLFAVGDSVRVASIGEVYSTYETVFRMMGFKNLTSNQSYSIPFVTERIAKVFDIVADPAKASKEILCGIRFDDGEMLLISQDGLVKFTGFEVEDIVVVLKNDKNYDNVVDRGPVRVVSKSYGGDYGKMWTVVEFSDKSTNGYNLLRYATDEEGQELNGVFESVEIGDESTKKIVRISKKGIYVNTGAGWKSLNIAHLEEVVSEMIRFKSNLASKYWYMSIPAINIGCTSQVTVEQLREIIHKAKEKGL